MFLYDELNKLNLEEKAIVANWTLFVIGWCVYFGVIKSIFMANLFIILTPLAAILIPMLIRYITSKLQDYGILSQNDEDISISTTINIEKDDISSASAKFFLHTFINLYILATSAKILAIAYGISTTGLISFFCYASVLVIMFPIILKESQALYHVFSNEHKDSTHKINRNLLAFSITVGVLVAAAVFFILNIASHYILIHYPLVYPSMLFITPLVTLEFLILIPYVVYIYYDHDDINIDHNKVVNNIIAFIGATFCVLFGLYNISCITGTYNIAVVSNMSLLSALGSTTLTFIFPIGIIFTLAVVAFLLNKNIISTTKDNNSVSSETKPLNIENIRHEAQIKKTESFETKCNDSTEEKQELSGTPGQHKK
jgi:hypothetical protein